MNIPEGMKVRFTHLRYFPHSDIPYTVWDAKNACLCPADFVPNAGATVCKVIEIESGIVMATATAKVNPGKDHFNKKIGRNISLGRALKQLGY